MCIIIVPYIYAAQYCALDKIILKNNDTSLKKHLLKVKKIYF